MQKFFENVSRYPRYFITFVLGIFYSLFQWVRPLFRNPASVVAFVGVLVSGMIFVVLTLRAMLGLAPV